MTRQKQLLQDAPLATEHDEDDVGSDRENDLEDYAVSQPRSQM